MWGGGPNGEESKGRNTEKLLEENTTRGFLKNLDTRQFAPNTQLPLTPDASPISAFIILQHSTAVDSDEHGPLHVSLLLVILTLWITLWSLLSAGVRTSADVSLKLVLRENRWTFSQKAWWIYVTAGNEHLELMRAASHVGAWIVLAWRNWHSLTEPSLMLLVTPVLLLPTHVKISAVKRSVVERGSIIGYDRASFTCPTLNNRAFSGCASQITFSLSMEFKRHC